MADEHEMKVSISRASSYRGSTTSGFLRLMKIPDMEVMNSLLIGVQQTVGALDLEPERDLLIQDFMTFESLTFPTKGSDTAPPHAFVSFKFLNYAPIAFKCFRGLFQIKTENFLNSMCSASLRQLENPGSSGSIFYLTHDDAFILKTVQQRESDFLLKLLPGYYLNLTQNPRTLLPKFFGFYCYSSLNKNIRIIVMNNLIPSNILINEKYDLKGSTSRRKATQAELKKPLPTYKDLDFLEHHPDGLLLEFDTYNALTCALERDCRVLESFKIIDYSLLLAVYYVDKKPNLKKFTCHSFSNKEPTRAIPARTINGEELLLFIGIIDILQSYKFRKKIEHTLKSIVYEKDSISVHRPDFYSQRFRDFLVKTVFHPMSKRKSAAPKTSPESQSSCSDGKTQEKSSLSLAWASTKTTYKKPSLDSVCEESHKESPLKGCKSNSKKTVPNSSEEDKTGGKENTGSVMDDIEKNDIELQAANIIALQMN